MFYTVYRTTNLVNGKRYYGVHKTKDPYDDYLGSGKILLRAIAKHGIENFRKDVLEIFDNPKQAFALEQELVDRELGTPGCYNLKRGGLGGYDFINSRGLSGCKLGALKAGQLFKRNYQSSSEFRERHKAIIQLGLAAAKLDFEIHREERIPKWQALAKAASDIWRGQHHYIFAKNKRRQDASNRVWVHLGEVKKFVVKETLDVWLSKGWLIGKKDKTPKAKRQVAMVTLTCQNCIKEFEKRASESKKTKFCTKACNAAFYHKQGVLKAPVRKVGRVV